MNKQIEEMAKVIETTFTYAKKWYPDKYEPFELDVYPDEVARTLYEQNYRKIPEGAVVLTTEELEEMVAAKAAAINNMATITRTNTITEMLERFKNTFGYCEDEELCSKAVVFQCIEVIAHAMMREAGNG